MWLALVIIAIIAGAILGVAGAGIYAVPIVLLMLGGALFLFMKQGQETATGGETPAADPDEVPQDTATDGVHKNLGPAYNGQDTMVPETQK